MTPLLHPSLATMASPRCGPASSPSFANTERTPCHPSLELLRTLPSDRPLFDLVWNLVLGSPADPPNSSRGGFAETGAADEPARTTSLPQFVAGRSRVPSSRLCRAMASVTPWTTPMDLRAGPDFEHLRAAHRAGSFGRRPTVLHRDLLCIRDFARCLAFHAIAGGRSCGLGGSSAFGHSGGPSKTVLVPR